METTVGKNVPRLSNPEFPLPLHYPIATCSPQKLQTGDGGWRIGGVALDFSIQSSSLQTLANVGRILLLNHAYATTPGE